MTKYASLLKQVDDLEAKVVGQKPRPCLWFVLAEGDDLAAAQAKAMAEWQAAHPKAKARAADDFDVIAWIVVKRERPDTVPLPSPPPSRPDVFGDTEEKARKRFRRRIHYPPTGVV